MTTGKEDSGALSPARIKKKTTIGGQALIEGIMMRGPKRISMAVRDPSHQMVVETWDCDMSGKPKFFRWPFFRGVFGFVDSMRYGYRCLMRSAEIAGLDDAENEKKEKKTERRDNGLQAAGAVKPAAEKSQEAQAAAVSPEDKTDQNREKASDGRMTAVMIIATVLGFVLALVLFKVLPETLYELLKKFFPALSGSGYRYQLIRSLFVGILKIAILIGYLVFVTLLRDIRRTFAYHGAEHKTVACYEAGLELTVENARAQKRFHPRCGTSFLILILLVSIIITMFIPANLSENGTLNVILRSLIGISLLPVMMSLGYELIRIAGKRDNLLIRIISAPGLWLQRITTKEPDDDMLECAIVALKNVIPGDRSDDWK
ncbi:MAG TPA: DUF1385 domain-containing protein [Clostridiales bacterium]|nr:DUF1385 domain-containing protein [Clostridiales bacterium]